MSEVSIKLIQQTVTAQHWEDLDRPKLAERFAAETQVLKPKAET